MSTRQWNFSSRTRRPQPTAQRGSYQPAIKQQVIASPIFTDLESALDTTTPTMRSTRSKTGTLPAKLVPFGAPVLEDEVVDAAIAKIEEDVDEEAAVEMAEELDDAIQAEEVITTFNSKQNIQGGAFIIRPLGKGKYELVNVQHVRRELLGSVEFGTILKSNPDRLALVESVKDDLENIKGNIVQAVDSANKKIFRFLSLSLEIRFMIYDLTIKCDCVLQYKEGSHKSTKGFSLRGVNKQLRDETASFFWSNNFNLSDFPNPKDDIRTLTFNAVADNLREVTFDWFAMARKDKLTLQEIAKCSNLKVVNIVVTTYAIADSTQHQWRRPLLYRSQVTELHPDIRIPKFSRTSGIDHMVRIRGLTKVNVKQHHGTVSRPKPTEITQAELDKLEAFLNERMTLPKIVPNPLASTNEFKARKTKGKRKSKGYRDADDDDSDYEGAGAKSRAKAKRRHTMY